MLSAGKVIKKTREKWGYSQAVLSDLSGVSKSMVAQIEKGTRKPAEDTLVKLLDSLGVTGGERMKALLSISPKEIQENFTF